MERENQPTASIHMHMEKHALLKIIWILLVWVFFNGKGTWKEEKRNILKIVLKSLNKQKPGEEEGHLT